MANDPVVSVVSVNTGPAATVTVSRTNPSADTVSGGFGTQGPQGLKGETGSSGRAGKLIYRYTTNKIPGLGQFTIDTSNWHVAGKTGQNGTMQWPSFRVNVLKDVLNNSTGSFFGPTGTPFPITYEDYWNNLNSVSVANPHPDTGYFISSSLFLGLVYISEIEPLTGAASSEPFQLCINPNADYQNQEEGTLYEEYPYLRDWTGWTSGASGYPPLFDANFDGLTNAQDVALYQTLGYGALGWGFGVGGGDRLVDTSTGAINPRMISGKEYYLWIQAPNEQATINNIERYSQSVYSNDNLNSAIIQYGELKGFNFKGPGVVVGTNINNSGIADIYISGGSGGSGANVTLGITGGYVKSWNGLSGTVNFSNYVSSVNGATGGITGLAKLNTEPQGQVWYGLQSFTDGISSATDIEIAGVAIGAGGGSNPTNIAFGNGALLNNIYDPEEPYYSNHNIALGTLSLNKNTYGGGNIAIGQETLYNNTSGGSNIAIGSQALKNTTIGQYNIAIGEGSLNKNENGNGNFALGYLSLIGLTNASNNTAIGTQALQYLKKGANNLALGNNSGQDTYTEAGSLSGGMDNRNQSIYIGYNTSGLAVASGATSEIVIGANAVGQGSNTTVIGASTQQKTIIYGLLNSPSGISASGATFSGNITAKNILYSLNGITGTVGISAGSNVTITAVGATFVIASSGGGGSSPLASASVTGVASFGNEFTVSALGAVSLTGNYVKSFNGLTGTVNYSTPIATSSVTGVASFGNEFTVSALGAVSLTGNYVKRFNGVTGSVGISAGSNITITAVGATFVIASSGGGSPPLATSSVTGVASFGNEFTVSNTGAVGLTSNYVKSINGLTGSLTGFAKTDTPQIFSAVQQFSSGITTENVYTTGTLTINGNVDLSQANGSLVAYGVQTQSQQINVAPSSVNGLDTLGSPVMYIEGINVTVSGTTASTLIYTSFDSVGGIRGGKLFVQASTSNGLEVNKNQLTEMYVTFNPANKQMLTTTTINIASGGTAVSSYGLTFDSVTQAMSLYASNGTTADTVYSVKAELFNTALPNVGFG
jgi:hypothetical protein